MYQYMLYDRLVEQYDIPYSNSESPVIIVADVFIFMLASLRGGKVTLAPPETRIL